MQVFKIPCSGFNEIFEITLKQKKYKLRLVYNDISECWQMDIYKSNDEPIILNYNIVSGLNILDQYQYLNFKGFFVTYADGNPDLIPTKANFTKDVNLYFVTGD